MATCFGAIIWIYTFFFYLSKKELNGESLNFGPKNSSKMEVIDIVKKLNKKWSNKNLIILKKINFTKSIIY